MGFLKNLTFSLLYDRLQLWPDFNSAETLTYIIPLGVIRVEYQQGEVYA